MPKVLLIIPAEIADFVAYDPDTGEVRWKAYHGRNNGRRPGPIIHRDTRGSIQFYFRGRQYLGHRVAYFLMTGEQPNIIDHINGDRYDNRWANLRSGTELENQRNRKKHRDGIPVGVTYAKSTKKWRARIPIADLPPGHKEVALGHFDTVEEAAEAVQAAVSRLKSNT